MKRINILVFFIYTAFFVIIAAGNFGEQEISNRTEITLIIGKNIFNGFLNPTSS